MPPDASKNIAPTVLPDPAPQQPSTPPSTKQPNLRSNEATTAAQIPAVVEALTPHYGPEAPVVVAYRVSWPDQVILRCTLATLADTMKESKISLTAIILIGPMLDPERAKNSHLYDRAFTHRFRRSSP